MTRFLLASVLTGSLLAGCASSPATAPGPETPLPFQLERVQEQERNGITDEQWLQQHGDWIKPTEHGMRFANDVMGLFLTDHNERP